MAGPPPLPETTSEGECVFCAIGAGRAPAAFVHEDDEFVGIVDLRPVTTGHLLVLPRAHQADLASLPAYSVRGCSRSPSGSPPRCAARTCAATGSTCSRPTAVPAPAAVVSGKAG